MPMVTNALVQVHSSCFIVVSVIILKPISNIFNLPMVTVNFHLQEMRWEKYIISRFRRMFAKLTARLNCPPLEFTFLIVTNNNITRILVFCYNWSVDVDPRMTVAAVVGTVQDDTNDVAQGT